MLFALAAAAGDARADGAFPDSQSPLAPPDRPGLLALATNFGLVFSEDGAKTWQYSCEVDATRNGRLYRYSAPVSRHLFAISDMGFVVSDDDACTWVVAGGVLANAVVSDGFGDPNDADHVLALGAPPEASGNQLYESHDGGKTFAASPIFMPPANGTLSGMEIATSAPGTIYVTYYLSPELRPMLARSDDGGATFTATDASPSLGFVHPLLAAVDPTDANIVYLRIAGKTAAMTQFEGLAITRDGGATYEMPIILERATLSTFFRRADGTLLVTAYQNETSAGAGGASGTTTAAVLVGLRSRDGGHTFDPWPLTVHPRGFAERDGTLLAATDDITDGFALQASADGDAWTPLLHYRDGITGIRACVKDICQDDCDYQAGITLIKPEACNPPDGGIAAGTGGKTGSSGCRYTPEQNGTPAGALSIAALATIAALRAARSRSRR